MQTMNHHKIRVMAEVKVSKEVRVAAVPAEACGVSKTSLTKTTLAGMNYVLYIFETNYLFNTSSNTKYEDVLNFSVNEVQVSLVIDSDVFLAIWVKTTVFQKITFVNNVCSLVTLR